MRSLRFSLAAVVLASSPVMASDALESLCTEYWEAHLERNPTTATSLGDSRFDHLLSDNSPEGYTRWESDLRRFLKRAEALDGTGLTQAEAVTLGSLMFQLRSALATVQCGMHEWTVGPRSGPQAGFFNIPSYTTLTDFESGKAMVARWQAMTPHTYQHIQNLKRGLAAGRVAPRALVERAIEQIRDLESKPSAEWSLITTPLENMPALWTSEEKARFEQGITKAVDAEFRPALMAYRDFLVKEILPQARSSKEPGLSHVPGGADCYDERILIYTTLRMDPQTIHKIGLEEVERINAETRELGGRVLGTTDLEAIHMKLRSDPDLHFTTREEVRAKAEEALARARAAMVDYFGILPQAPCIVTPMEPHEEKHSTIAYYRRPPADGSRPGRYYVNTYAPETRPRYEAEALAFHEAIPGHHLQIAIAQELKNIPEFRKHQGTTAFIEGWALYTERLSNEMGLYSSDMDRIGMLSYDSWRACRLVVDTGLHALGWSRQQAIDYMAANSCLALNNIENEVDRYIAWPGQALAYKMGQREIFRLRSEAQAALGEDFDIKTFHDVVLSQGAVDLATLSIMVNRWIKDAQSVR